MRELRELIGCERDLSSVSDAMKRMAVNSGASVIGGFHITCSDEVECECVSTFDRLFAEGLLPELKPGVRAPFRTMNLGARYESGSIRVAEEHYATRETQDKVKLLLVKLNSHTAVQNTQDELEYGWLQRYNVRSACCGALMALLSNTEMPAVVEIRKLFQSDNKDRMGLIMDERRVCPKQRALFFALINARLQASLAVSEIMAYKPSMPTMYAVVPCVTINRPGPDTEIVVGLYLIDATDDVKNSEYVGLSDWPGDYRVRHERERLIIEGKGIIATD